MPQHWDVAVVGAGPIGLLLAGELAARDVRVVVFERGDAPSPIPKANGIVGHSAVELAKRGVLAGTGLRVVSPSQFQFGPLMLKLAPGPGIRCASCRSSSAASTPSTSPAGSSRWSETEHPPTSSTLTTRPATPRANAHCSTPGRRPCWPATTTMAARFARSSAN
jgi:choline dehydrogenase-like flavoprotein